MILTYKQILDSRKGMRTLFGCCELPFKTAVKVAKNSFSLDLALKTYYEKAVCNNKNKELESNDTKTEDLKNESVDVCIDLIDVSELEKVFFRPCDINDIAFMLREDEYGSEI